MRRPSHKALYNALMFVLWTVVRLPLQTSDHPIRVGEMWTSKTVVYCCRTLTATYLNVISFIILQLLLYYLVIWLMTESKFVRLFAARVRWVRLHWRTFFPLCVFSSCSRNESLAVVICRASWPPCSASSCWSPDWHPPSTTYRSAYCPTDRYRRATLVATRYCRSASGLRRSFPTRWSTARWRPLSIKRVRRTAPSSVTTGGREVVSVVMSTDPCYNNIKGDCTALTGRVENSIRCCVARKPNTNDWVQVMFRAHRWACRLHTHTHTHTHDASSWNVAFSIVIASFLYFCSCLLPRRSIINMAERNSVHHAIPNYSKRLSVRVWQDFRAFHPAYWNACRFHYIF